MQCVTLESLFLQRRHYWSNWWYNSKEIRLYDSSFSVFFFFLTLIIVPLSLIKFLAFWKCLEVLRLKGNHVYNLFWTFQNIIAISSYTYMREKMGRWKLHLHISTIICIYSYTQIHKGRKLKRKGKCRKMWIPGKRGQMVSRNFSQT